MKLSLARARKAYGAAVLAAGAAYTSALDGGVSAPEWGGVIGFAVATFLATYFLRNAPDAA